MELGDSLQHHLACCSTSKARLVVVQRNFYMCKRYENRIPDSNFSLQQSCINLALQICSFQQVWHGKSASLKRVIANDEVITRQTFSKLVASNSLQTIAKSEYVDEPQIETPENPLSKPVALAI
ncbi:hypothetical protein AVEN_200411-1 [Araneus ventricosus]|uniref:Uncharacterized protein n=1 Tax=Araneus ventricosus TaxID=182803 RepID=A0A4Y2K2T4_ARAVE|nr:hypothetical protein AVEN_240030-1 [Araneus ventricosus]GBM96122.1 hypothetical protein AVEN_28820-1 [Araneus ventricosus]GBM96138.1 hypothetical protein AVEN_129102-1 [Araneus ventricosus]GBM96159.1 hypothetical protein AVEN_200411-1 [Araneus ventricosus]